MLCACANVERHVSVAAVPCPRREVMGRGTEQVCGDVGHVWPLPGRSTYGSGDVQTVAAGMEYRGPAGEN